MRLSGVYNNLAIPVPAQFKTASSLAALPNSPRLREAHAFGVKILRIAKIGDLQKTVHGSLHGFVTAHWGHEPRTSQTVPPTRCCRCLVGRAAAGFLCRQDAS